MDLIKIGKFISLKRKEKGITQSDLAEKLYITDRAISKWENGICLPDASTMIDLCEILNITINDLFCGEVVDMKENEKKLEYNLLEMTKQKEEKDRQLLHFEIVIGIITLLFVFALIITAYLAPMDDWVKYLLICISLLLVVMVGLVLTKIEQVAGYYECNCCHHKYIPTFLAINIAPHFGRTRHMKCPKCGKKSWQEKVISK